MVQVLIRICGTSAYKVVGRVKVVVPKNEQFENYVKEIYRYKKIGDFGVIAEYQGIFEIQIDRGYLGMNRQEFVRFFKKIIVRGGSKRKSKNTLLMIPFREKSITIRLPRSYYDLLYQVAEKFRRRASDYARLALMARICEVLKALGWPEHEIKQRKIRFQYRSDETIGNTWLKIRLSRDEDEILKKLVGGQVTSEYVRLILESDLLNTARELGLLVPVTKPQTSEAQRNPR